MRRIDVTHWTPSAAWITRADAATTKLRGMNENERRSFVKLAAASQLWGDLRDELLGLSHDKCWYSEASIGAGDAQVEHFRPKLGCAVGVDRHDGYWWLAFSYGNYRLAASVPNRTKSNEFPILGSRAVTEGSVLDDELPVLLDPISVDDVSLLTFAEGGTPTPAAHATPNDRNRVTYSIRRYGLDAATLSRQRQAKWAQCKNAIRSWEMVRVNAAISPSARGQASVLAQTLRDLADPSAPFSSSVRACMAASEAARAVALGG